MVTRITTGMTMNTYRYNLQNSTLNLANATNMVQTHRLFNSFSEAPSVATQAWRIRRAMMDNASYQKNNTNTLSRFNIAWATMGTIKTNLESAAEEAEIRARNDPEGSARNELGKILSDTADSVIQAMNSAKYGDHFVFSGDDEMNAPFSWSEDGKTLYYRGVNVNAGLMKDPTTAEAIPAWAKDSEGNAVGLRHEADLPEEMPAYSSDSDEQDWIDYYNDYKRTLESGGDVTQLTKPSSPAPDWALDENNNEIVPELEYKVPEGMPESSNDVYEQAWMEYYNNLMDEVEANGGDADAAMASVQKPTDPPAWSNADRYGVPEEAKDVTDASSAYERMWAAYYRDQGDVQRLDEMSDEYVNVDLGMGLQERDGVLVNGTAFNRALPGINMLGYGVDEDGDPKNIVMIFKRLGEIYSNCDSDTGKFSADADENDALTVEVDRLMNKVQDALQLTRGSYTDIATKAHYLTENESRLDLQSGYLQEERANLEDVELADAITQFSWDYYCYSAALKIGTQLLSQSLIDYMT